MAENQDVVVLSTLPAGYAIKGINYMTPEEAQANYPDGISDNLDALGSGIKDSMKDFIEMGGMVIGGVIGAAVILAGTITAASLAYSYASSYVKARGASQAYGSKGKETTAQIAAFED